MERNESLESISASAELVGSRIHVLRATAERDAAAQGARAQAFQEALSLVDEMADLNENREKLASFLQLGIRRGLDEQRRHVHQRDAYTAAIGEATNVAQGAGAMASGTHDDGEAKPAAEQ